MTGGAANGRSVKISGSEEHTFESNESRRTPRSQRNSPLRGDRRPSRPQANRLGTSDAAELKNALKKSRGNIDTDKRPTLGRFQQDEVRDWVRETHNIAKSTELKEVRRLLRNISPDAFWHIRKTFTMMDSDGSGDISKEELNEVLLSYNICCTEEELDNIFSEIDGDGGDSLGFDEFIKVVSSRIQDPVTTAFRWILLNADTLSKDERRIADLAHETQVSYSNVGLLFRRFAEMDVDRSGTIERAEFDELVKMMIPTASEMELHDWWRFVDADHDKSVTFEEFMQRWVKIVPNSVEYRDHAPEVLTFRHLREAADRLQINMPDDHCLLMIGLGNPGPLQPGVERGVTQHQMRALIEQFLNEQLRIDQDPLAEMLCSLQGTFIARVTMVLWRKLALATHRSHELLGHLRYALLEEEDLDPDFIAQCVNVDPVFQIAADLSATDVYRHNHSALHFLACIPQRQGPAPDIEALKGTPFKIWPRPTSALAQAAKLILEGGADVEAANDFGWTPLYASVEKNNFEMVWMLMIYSNAVAQVDQYILHVSKKAIMLRYRDPYAGAIAEILNQVVQSLLEERHEVVNAMKAKEDDSDSLEGDDDDDGDDQEVTF
mmetsp:Transcript_29444/g.75432  ORF Transcript_29444/g.75432 Transcript_29444/m.75432 type:complete len:607 (-) Transcript_29444:79-1899(-)